MTNVPPQEVLGADINQQVGLQLTLSDCPGTSTNGAWSPPN